MNSPDIPGIPPDVRRFLVSAVPSVPFLEAALLLCGDPDSFWNAQRLSARLYIPQRKAQGLLLALAEAGLAAPADSGNRFRCADDAQVRDLLEKVGRVYARNLSETTHLIHAKVDNSAQRFADAFKLRKD